VRFRDTVANLPGGEQRLIMGQNGRRLVGLP
jgi:hypothetical protein